MEMESNICRKKSLRQYDMNKIWGRPYRNFIRRHMFKVHNKSMSCVLEGQSKKKENNSRNFFPEGNWDWTAGGGKRFPGLLKVLFLKNE